MYAYVAALALAGSASARVLPRDQAGCCFQLTASGGKSGTVGQLSDGQNRIGGDYKPATYCLNNGGLTDSNGRGCILTPPTTQFQCDVGATPTTGFSVSGSGEVEYNGSDQFYACGAASGEYNIYTKPVENQADCVKVTLSTGGKCSGNGGGGSGGSSAPAMSAASTQPAGGASSSAPAYGQSSKGGASSAPASTQPAAMSSQPKPSSKQPAPETSMASQPKPYTGAPKPMTSQPAPALSQPQPEMSQPAPQECQSPPAVSQPQPEMSQPQPEMSQPAAQTSQPKPEMSQPAAQTSQPKPEMSQPKPYSSQPAMQTSQAPAASSQPKPEMSQPAAETSQPKPYASQPKPQTSQPAQKTSQAPAPSNSAPASSPAMESSAPAMSSSGSTSTAQGSACQTSLSGAYQTPHLIVPISKEQPDQSYGTNYNGQINSTTSTIFNFDIPQDYEGKQCSIVFLFPKKEDLETSDYTFGGSGSLGCSELSSSANEKTSWSNAPSVAKDLGSYELQPGNSYVVATQDCKAGETQSIELSSENGLSLNFFEDWNPSPLGLFITSC